MPAHLCKGERRRSLPRGVDAERRAGLEGVWRGVVERERVREESSALLTSPPARFRARAKVSDLLRWHICLDRCPRWPPTSSSSQPSSSSPA